MIAATVAFLVAALWTLQYTTRALRPRPSVSLLLFAALLLVHVAPMLIYLHVTGPDTFIYEAALAPVDAEPVKARVLWALTWMFVSLMVGAGFARLIAPRSWVRAQWAASRPAPRHVASVYRASSALRLVLWLVAASMLAVILIEDQPAKILNYFASGESELEKLLLRSEDGGTRFYVYNAFLYSVAPFLVMVLWCMRRAHPKDHELGALFACFFVLVVVGKLGTLSKAPPVIFLLQLALLYLLLKGKALSWWPLTKLLLLALALFAVMVKLTIPEIELSAVLQFLYYRVFDIPNEVVLEYFAAFPRVLRHGWEYGIFGPLSRSANELVLPNYSVVAELTRDSLDSTSNVMFVGDAWAEYAWPGVVFSSFAAGLLVRSIDLYSLRKGFTDESACLVAGCAFGVVTMLSTALSTALVTGGLILIPMASWLFARRSRRTRAAVASTLSRST